MPAYILKDIIFCRSEPTQEKLQELKASELECICKALGVSYSGNKEQMITRILNTFEIRMKLKHHKAVKDEIKKKDWRETHPLDFLPDPGIEAMMKDFKSKDLKAMCRAVHASMCDGRKYTMCASLLNWRKRCRKHGQDYLMKLYEESKKYPQQMELWA